MITAIYLIEDKTVIHLNLFDLVNYPQLITHWGLKFLLCNVCVEKYNYICFCGFIPSFSMDPQMYAFKHICQIIMFLFSIRGLTPLKILISNIFVCLLSEDYIVHHYFILEQMMYENFQENFKPSSFWLIQVVLKAFNIMILYVMDQEEGNLFSYLQTCCDQLPTVKRTKENWPKTPFWRWWIEVDYHEENTPYWAMIMDSSY